MPHCIRITDNAHHQSTMPHCITDNVSRVSSMNE